MKIQSTKDLSLTGKIRFMVYAYSGAGKTELVGTLPGKTLVLNADKGMLTLRNKDIDFVSANNWSAVVEFLNYIKTSECQAAYTNLAFDSVSAIAHLLYLDLLEEKKLDGHKLWQSYGLFMMKFLTMLKDQTHYHTYSIFECIDREDESGVMSKTYGIQGQAGGKVANFFDEVYALRVNKDGTRFLQTI